MARPHFTRQEKKEIRAIKLEQALHGEGLYIYENASKIGDLKLPRPTASGIRVIKPGQQFQGDNYYMGMVRSNDLRLIKEIVSPETERKALEKEQKLLLDQPDVITEAGTVERVVKKKTTKSQKLHDATNPSPPILEPDVLLTEDPMAGVEIVME